MKSITVYERSKKVRQLQSLKARLMIMNIEAGKVAQEIAILQNELSAEHIVVGKVARK